jgi:digeranylgeranylglycerophospholipid reductase
VGLGAVASYDRNPYPDRVELFLDPDAAPGWFGWTIPLEDGLARLGTGSANGIRPRESFRRLQRTFPGTFGAARVHTYSGGLIALWQPTAMTADSVMLVGDAARQVKPTSGGGIHAALHAAGLAATVADEALRRGDLSQRALRGYPRGWHASLGRELRRQHDMRRVFERLTAQDLEEIIELLDDGGVRAAIDETADIDFPSRLVTRIGIRRPRLAMKLLRLPRFPFAWLPGG